MTPVDTDPAGLPPWTREQVAVVLTLLFGAGRRGGPDTTAAAAALGVSRRSVQRWLHPGPGPTPAISAAHLAQVHALARPDEAVLRDEQRTADYAHDALARIALPRGRGVLPAWRQQQWLDQHLVTVTELEQGIQQVSLTRLTSRAQQRGERTKHGPVVDYLVVATRFHAQLLAHQLLQELTPWRVRGRALAPKQGATRTWLPDAPTVDLAGLAVAHGLR